MSNLLTKSAIMRVKGWSYEFLTALIKDANVPGYLVGKSLYYTLEDVEAGMKSRRNSWESTKKKVRRIGNTISPSKGKDIVAAPRQAKRAKLRLFMQSAEARHY